MLWLFVFCVVYLWVWFVVYLTCCCFDVSFVCYLLGCACLYNKCLIVDLRLVWFSALFQGFRF